MGEGRAMQTAIILVYVALLLGGGWMGFRKAGSRVSLITSAVAAVILLATLALPAGVAGIVRHVVFGLLLAAFIVRLAKTRKFMPSGLLVLLTGVAWLLVALS